jgi:branched-subunit amino acid ABC-type transport system permease component
MIGIVQYVIGAYWFKNYNSLLVFVMMIGIIAIKPTGLFTKGQTHGRL